MNNYDKIFRKFAMGNISPFYDEMYPGMMLYAMHILGEEFSYMAEDCVQESVITTYMRREEFPSWNAWRGFLLACIRNNAIAVLRKNSRHKNYIDNLEQEDTENDCSHALIEHEVHELLFNAIDGLSDKYREIFQLSFESGLKNSEVANILGIAEITVKKRKASLIAHLQDKLGGILDEKSIIVILTTHISYMAV